MTDRDLLEVKEVFSTKGWKFFETWLKDIKIKALEEQTDEPLANETNSLLNREALIGAKRYLNYLILDFKEHINTELEK